MCYHPFLRKRTKSEEIYSEKKLSQYTIHLKKNFSIINHFTVGFLQIFLFSPSLCKNIRTIVDVVWIESQGTNRTNTNVDVVWMHCQGRFGTGTEMDAVWVQCLGIYKTDTEVKTVQVESQGIYRTGTNMVEVWVECQSIYRTGTDMDTVWVEWHGVQWTGTTWMQFQYSVIEYTCRGVNVVQLECKCINRVSTDVAWMQSWWSARVGTWVYSGQSVSVKTESTEVDVGWVQRQGIYRTVELWMYSEQSATLYTGGYIQDQCRSVCINVKLRASVRKKFKNIFI